MARYGGYAPPTFLRQRNKLLLQQYRKWVEPLPGSLNGYPTHIPENGPAGGTRRRLDKVDAEAGFARRVLPGMSRVFLLLNYSAIKVFRFVGV